VGRFSFKFCGLSGISHRQWRAFRLCAAALLLLGLLSAPAQAQSDSQTSKPNASDPGAPGPTLTFPQFSGAKTIHIVAYGDMRFTDPSVTKGTNPRIRKWLAERIAAEHPEVLLLTGDMPYTGAKASDWTVFQQETAAWKTGGFLQLPTLGNHETYGGIDKGIANYLDNFPQIERHRFYSALLGNVEVISLDMNTAAGTAGDQAHWFAAQLDHLPKQVDFVLILYHTPWMADEQSQIFASLPDQQALVLRGILEARLEKIRARVVVFNGHIHNYERFERRGVEYIVTGGGGAAPYPLLLRGGQDLYRDTGFPVYHYLTVEVTGRELHAAMWKVNDPDAETLSVEKKDEFSVTAPTRKSLRKPASRSDANLPTP
jgi:hypothetical protein